jgi:hypothetical protein
MAPGVITLSKTVDLPDDINENLTCPTGNFLIGLLGLPRANFSDVCQRMTNKNLLLLIKTADVGPFTVTGLRPAIDSLKKILDEINTEQKEVYSKLGTAGMLGCRYIKSKTRTRARKISSHSWGTAIDLTIDGHLDSRGDGMSQYGLTLIYKIFNRHGWYWGAGFQFEDSMHFEVSREKLREWKRAGALGTGTGPIVTVIGTSMKGEVFSVPVALQLGHKGPVVRKLQKMIMQRGTLIKIDGIFGPKTEHAVMELQRRLCLRVDGIVGPKTGRALGWR